MSKYESLKWRKKVLNLLKLYEMQKKLDSRFKYPDKDTQFIVLITALRVEISEMMNEWRGFKLWSNDRKPRPSLLEEYVDGLHFILSLGNLIDCRIKISYFNIPNLNEGVLEQVEYIHDEITLLRLSYFSKHMYGHYENLMMLYLGLGRLLNFTEVEITRAYKKKNNENHKRIDDGY